MNRKLYIVVIPILVVVEIFSVFLMIKSYRNFDSSMASKKVENIVNKKQFSMFVENSSGNYEEYTNSNYFPTGYTLNVDKTMCTDNRGVEVFDVLSVNNNYITVNSPKTVYCYLYFDLN